MKELEMLNTIKNIELSHIEQERDENFEGEFEHVLTEVQDGTVGDNFGSEIETIEKAVKALRIIKEQMVNVYWLFVCFEEGGLERYNDDLDKLYLSVYHLTQEEYELLREVLL